MTKTPWPKVLRFAWMAIFMVPLLLLVALPAHANFDRAKKEYEALDLARKAKISLGLIATGDFDGLTVLGYTKRLYNGIVAFQKREGLRADGTLSDREIDLLVKRYQEFASQFGVRTVANPVSGASALVPSELFSKTTQTKQGVDLTRDDGKMSIGLFAIPTSETSFDQLYESFSKGDTAADKFVSYKTKRQNYFVVSGIDKGQQFYVFMNETPAESTGFLIFYDSSLLAVGQKTAVLMANSFTVGDPAGSVDEPQTENPPEVAVAPPDTGGVQPPPEGGGGQPTAPPTSSTGTGFRITEAGHVLTNFHVAGQCKSIRLHRIGEVPIDASLVARDEVNDLAVVKAVSALPGAIAKFSPKGRVRAGSEIVVFGFPLTGLLADSGNFTTGNITSMAGMGNDSRLYQISAPVQPGNSGGPVLDRHGGIVAVVVSKLNAMGVANKTGDVPQNVNFAIKSNVALGFLDGIGILLQDHPQDAPMLDTPTLAEQARDFTFLIECNNE
jgi:serine protease Do